MHSVTCFFSMAAGRGQGVDHISITTIGEVAERSPHLKLHLSHRIKPSSDIEQHRPHPADVPFDPIDHQDEFSSVLSDWAARHDKWRVARVRYLGCMRKGNRYGVNRLVAAANMFDILPADAVPVPATLTDDLAATRDACIDMLRKLPEGIDRNSALSALGRLGQPSLPKKVAHRTAMVDSMLSDKLPDLQFVASVAVKCRNFFVHGSSKDFDYARVEALLPFLTDALEFIFAASDFIEAGWDSKRWISESHSWGHSFARFAWHYRQSLDDLRRAISR
jgi:hypothetical protein